MKEQPALSDTELIVMKALWERSGGTVRDLGGVPAVKRREWAYTTVQTLLNRLVAKGYATVDKRVSPHVYTPKVSRDGLLKQRLGSLIEQVCEGTATPLVMALVSEKRFSPDDLAHFRRILDEAEAEQEANE